LSEVERARVIYGWAVSQQDLDRPEVVWKSAIDFELSLNQYDNARVLYSNLLKQTQHPRVWESFARMEHSLGQYEQARSIYMRGFDLCLKKDETNEERFALLELWKEFEEDVADEVGEEQARFDEIKKRVPKKVKRKRRLLTEDGQDAGFEEYYDYLFPDMLQKNPNLKLLEAARKWKKTKQSGEDQ